MQGMCTVGAEYTIGSETILDAPDGTHRWVMLNLVSIHLETGLVSVQDRCMICTECTTGSETILDAPDVISR
jgi:hypothetical protein